MTSAEIKLKKYTAVWSYQGGDVILTRLKTPGDLNLARWDQFVEELERQDAAQKDTHVVDLVPQDVSLYAIFEGHAEMVAGTAS